MRYLMAFPLIALVLIAYNVMVFTDPGWLWAEASRVNMMSGAVLSLQWADMLIMTALFMLFVEVLKAARVETSSSEEPESPLCPSFRGVNLYARAHG